MKLSRTLICTLAAAAAFAALPATAQKAALTIGGQPVATLTRPYSKAATKPQFVQAEFLPGEGMNLVQLKAFIPGKGVVPLFFAPPLPEIKAKLEAPDPFGNEAFKLGGAFLLPYPNRIRGMVGQYNTIVETYSGNKILTLPANWHGVKPGAELHAMHGLILKAQFGDVKAANGADKSEISASLNDAFGKHWPSKTDVKIQASLTNDVLDLQVTATNVGTEVEPMAIGMHPYFAFPSGKREQARVHLPATIRTPANNYDDVFPLGTLEPVKGTRFDFTAPEGALLSTTEMVDDCFTGIERNADGNVEIRVTDPAANYGLKVLGISKEIKAIQMYAPLGKNFAAIEPQYNLADPFNKKLWGAQDTGMVYLKPGESTVWHVQFVIYALK